MGNVCCCFGRYAVSAGDPITATNGEASPSNNASDSKREDGTDNSEFSMKSKCSMDREISAELESGSNPVSRKSSVLVCVGDSIEATHGDASPLIDASDTKRGNGADNPGCSKGPTNTSNPPTHDLDTDDESEDDNPESFSKKIHKEEEHMHARRFYYTNKDSANGKKSKIQASLDRLQMAITSKTGREVNRVREETVVKVAQHTTERIRKTYTHDPNVTKGVCIIYDDCSSEDDLSADVDRLYRQFSFFDIEKNVNDINSLNNENYDFFAIYILDGNRGRKNIIENINEMSTDVPRLIVLFEAESETSIEVAEISLRNTLVFKGVNRKLLMEFNNELLIQSVTFDISSINQMAMNRALTKIKKHDGLCIETDLERKVFLQRKSDEDQDYND